MDIDTTRLPNDPDALKAMIIAFAEKENSFQKRIEDLEEYIRLLKNEIFGRKSEKRFHFCHVFSTASIGEDCTIGQNVMIGPEVEIGKGCKIQNNASVYTGVVLEDHVFCGPSMVFTNIYNPRAHIDRMDQVGSTRVGNGATLGANCTIICGVRIGKYAMVGAGSVVNRDVADHELVVGNPCRRIGWVCECGGRLDDDFRCKECGPFCKRD